MLKTRTTIIDRDVGYRRFIEAIEGLEESVSVLVGLRGEQGEDLIRYAAANEFGTARIPERSFLRSTVDREQTAYVGELTQAIDAYIDQGRDAAIVDLKRLGVRAVGDVQTTIRELREPINKESTVARKGSSNPLIDTGRMRQSIDYVVVEGDEDRVVG
jgi:hypothetical protein